MRRVLRHGGRALGSELRGRARGEARLLPLRGVRHSYAGFPASSGIAELPGNDFMVTLGGKTAAWIAAAGGMRPAEAGTFMHELGHNLDLRHGGFEDAPNCKPNYQSVMTYTRQVPYIDPTRPLDYSRELLPPLNESALDEPDGVGGATGNVVFGVNGAARVASAAGPIDWNGDSLFGLAIAADISRIETRPDGSSLSGCGPIPGQVLRGERLVHDRVRLPEHQRLRRRSTRNLGPAGIAGADERDRPRDGTERRR